jgi:hypothetical protein
MTMKNAPTIDTVSHHHMPDGADYPLSEGMTLRQALAALRKANGALLGEYAEQHQDHITDLERRREERLPVYAQLMQIQ